MNGFVVELEPGVWLSDGEGDPCRTLNRSFARVFKSAGSARSALRMERERYPSRGFDKAKVCMSFCRISSDHPRSDVSFYINYAGRYVINVAKVRRVLTEPLPPPVLLAEKNMRAWIERHNKVVDILENAPLVPIGLPHDGEDFEFANVEDAVAKLKELQALGYIVPQAVIDCLANELE